MSAQLGEEPQHFVVEEIPAYEPSGLGEHLYLWVEKQELTTAEVAKRLALRSGTKERDIGYAGMKDKHAITRQWFSVLGPHADAQSWDLGEGVSIRRVTRHNNKLRTGHLIGNRFELTLLHLDSQDEGRARHIAEQLSNEGFLNAYGGQRFGYKGKNLSQAIRWLDEVAMDVSANEAVSPRPKNGKRGPSRFDNKLHPSVIQSEFFNRYAAARIDRKAELIRGEVVRLKGTGTHFVVEDVDRELPRKRAGDLILTGAMPGKKTLQSRDEAAQLEQQIWDELGFSAQRVQALMQSAPGARRDLLVVPEDLCLRSVGDTLVLSFALPAGSFATELLRQFNDGDWLEPRKPRRDPVPLDAPPSAQ